MTLLFTLLFLFLFIIRKDEQHKEPGNLLLTHCVPNFKGIAFEVAEHNAAFRLITRARKQKLNIPFLRMRIEPTTCRVYSHTLSQASI